VHTATGPLAAVRVLDLGRLLPAGFATLILAELGADVVKVEAPPAGDPSRRIAPFQRGESHHHLSVNRGKRSLCLDLKTAEGRGVFLRLADSADVVLDNFRPGVAARLGIDYAALSRRNPRLVYCALSGFGRGGGSGPRDDRAAGGGGASTTASPAIPSWPLRQCRDIRPRGMRPIDRTGRRAPRGIMGYGRAADADEG
jgi:crotonobetainyl-CoA:carnitine CoA-transferase CaiB-like acyl-CoA transferase